jgi:hypothetical protein
VSGREVALALPAALAGLFLLGVAVLVVLVPWAVARSRRAGCLRCSGGIIGPCFCERPCGVPDCGRAEQ